MKLFSNTMSLIESALGYSSLKQKVISQNIANIDTPNYKAKNVSFKEILQKETSQNLVANRSDQRHISFENNQNQMGSVVRRNTTYNHNGNSVDLDQEMSDLASNQIYYNALVERMNGKFSTLQNVIRGGK
ncbi:flagellar basal body rod protein FlgB [Bacillus sp. 03113]|uniref:flagellar basal body rod protein FlgB n=1 Tax=Bacillus sp. 03113 TaxID=2578211 RepID=UPI001143DBA7